MRCNSNTRHRKQETKVKAEIATFTKCGSDNLKRPNQCVLTKKPTDEKNSPPTTQQLSTSKE